MKFESYADMLNYVDELERMGERTGDDEDNGYKPRVWDWRIVKNATGALFNYNFAEHLPALRWLEEWHAYESTRTAIRALVYREAYAQLRMNEQQVNEALGVADYSRWICGTSVAWWVLKWAKQAGERPVSEDAGLRVVKRTEATA